MSVMRWVRRAVLGLAAGGVVAGVPAARAADEKKEEPKPKVEVVFVLDTTGSMGGLIDAAKAKIWAISNQIVSGKPSPDVKIGLVAYRDKGDAYVTQITDLSDDLDAIHAKLKEFKADGGGDGPEHVNAALNDAVTKVKWGKDKDTLKIVFLVGDAPPHMDYNDDVKYPETCKKAVEAGIIINTVQCGKDAETAKVWQDVALKSEGSYVAIAQDGGVAAVATPFDKRLTEINTELTKSSVAYGSERKRQLADAKKDGVLKEAEKAEEIAAGKPGAGGAPAGPPAAAAPAADRIAYLAKSGRVSADDLLDDIKAKRVKLEDLKDEELPEDLRKMKPEERKAHLDKLEAKREELRKEAVDLDKKRNDFIKTELEKKGKGKDGFDNQVLDMLRKQAKKAKIDY